MSVKIKVMTFNLRVRVKSDGVNFFDNRLSRVIETIEDESPDLIGFQECNAEMKRMVTDALPKYIILGCGRERDYGGEAMAIAVKKHVFEIISMENRWLSSEPTRPGTTFGGDQSGCPRLFCALELKHGEGDAPFIFLNTHLDHKGPLARLLGAYEVMQYLSDRARPFVVTGDMNALPDAPEIGVFTASRPSGAEVYDLTAGLGGTFHGFGRRSEPSKIDYIFSDLPADASESYKIADDAPGGVYISDHNPVVAFVEV